MCYQLQQKRRLINELKAELEYCRKKWALARAINNESEEQCREMRKEFSLRKIQDQNSGESGYSDEHEDEDDKITKTKRFDRNLLMFDRTASPTFTDRRRSESPMLQDFTNLCIFSRAQSEPPQNFEKSLNDREVEIHDLVTEFTEFPCEEAATQSQHEGNSQEEVLIVQSPPVVHDYDQKNPPKVKTNLRKNKKKKKNNGQSETAEEMFKRLMGVLNGENSTTSATTDDDDLENIEEIPLDPLPETAHEEVQSESSDDFVHIDEVPEIPQETPSTSKGIQISAEQEYLQRREARLARLEAEAKEFYEKMTRDKEKHLKLTNKLTNVHQNFLDREKRRTKSEDNDGSNNSTDDDNDGENVDEKKANQNVDDDGQS